MSDHESNTEGKSNPEEPVNPNRIVIDFELVMGDEVNQSGIMGSLTHRNMTHHINLIPMERDTLSEREMIRLSKEFAVKVATAIASVVIHENRELVERPSEGRML